MLNVQKNGKVSYDGPIKVAPSKQNKMKQKKLWARAPSPCQAQSCEMIIVKVHNSFCFDGNYSSCSLVTRYILLGILV